MDAEITRMLDEGCPHGHDADEVAREVEQQGWVELAVVDGTRVSLPVETIDLADARRDPELAALVGALWGIDVGD